MERWMTTNAYTATQAVVHAEGVLRSYGADATLGHRMVDRMIQRLRKSKVIGFQRVKGKGTIWSAGS